MPVKWEKIPKGKNLHKRRIGVRAKHQRFQHISGKSKVDDCMNVRKNSVLQIGTGSGPPGPRGPTWSWLVPRAALAVRWNSES